MFAFAAARPRRRPSLTPMIDVVFLLLVFFMLAARFGQDMAVPLTTASGGGDWTGAPRLITLTPDGQMLNGVAYDPATLIAALTPLMPEKDAPVVLRAAQGADLARLVRLMGQLRAAGFTQLVLVE